MSKEKFRPNLAIPSADLESFILLLKGDKKEARSIGHNAKFFSQHYANMSRSITGLILTGKMTLFSRPD